jgi:hypothetical protein
MVEQHQIQLGPAPYLGAHIRMLHDQKKDIPGIVDVAKLSPLGLARANQAAQYRKSCHVNIFIPKIDQETENYEFLFAASDSQEALEALRARYGDRVVSTHESISEKCRGIDRRGAYCAQVAFSEFVTLSRASYILTSTWSSASEIVVRLSESGHQNGCEHMAEEPSGFQHFWKSFLV